MGALAHYLEAEEIPTTQISLIREHTEIIRPPRALWVPFALGRPLGVPGDSSFQRRVLLAALKLFDFDKGPVLVDFPEDTPDDEPNINGSSLADLACPVNFTSPAKEETETDKILAAFAHEMAQFRSWYDLGFERRGYSTAVCFSPDAAAGLLSDFVLGNPVQLPESVASPATALRLAAQDLKTVYFEAVMARPDFSTTEPSEFADWFWHKTAAGNLLRLVKEICLSSNDQQLKLTGGMLLVPLDQV